MSNNKTGTLIDQMMSALAKKKQTQQPSIKNEDGTVKQTKPVRNQGPIKKVQKKVTGRGRWQNLSRVGEAVTRQAHNLKIGGSIPSPATISLLISNWN